MAINLEIPRTMTVAGLEYLERLAAAVPEKGTIVEVGPLYGSSTWTLARSCHPSVTVYSIDTWERVPWIVRNVEEKLGAPPFSLEAFKGFVADCPNVVPIQGYSPEVVRDWARPIDLYFDDAAHGNPGFINNLGFFNGFVRPGGLLCGDDYALGSPDIVREIDFLGASWGVRPEVIGRVWALRKPAEGRLQSEGVAAALAPLPAPQLRVTAHCDGALPHAAPPRAWAGQLLKAGALRAFRLDWCGQPEGLEVRYWAAGRRSRSEDCAAGELCSLPEADDVISSLSIRLEGEAADGLDVLYQAGMDRGSPVARKLKTNTPASRNGQVLTVPAAGGYFSALRVVLQPAAAASGHQKPVTTAPWKRSATKARTGSE